MILENTLTVTNGAINMGSNGGSKDSIIMSGAALNVTNNEASTVAACEGNNSDYSNTTQAITSATLTAVTNARTPNIPNKGTAAAYGAGGVLITYCKVVWNQTTAGTLQFDVAASATLADIWVSGQASPSASTGRN